MELLIGVGVALMVLTVVAVVTRDRAKERQRTDALAPMAAVLGLPFQAAPGGDFLKALPKFPLLARGRDPLVHNLFSGQHRSRGVRLFDYSFLEATGSESDRYNQTLLVVDAKLAVPDFAAHSKTVADRVASALTKVPHIDVGPEFSREFVLTGQDADAIRRLFQPPLLAFFAAHPGLSVEVTGGSLLLYRYNTESRPSELPPLLEEALALCDQLATTAAGAAAR